MNGERLAKARKEKGLTQAQLADLIGTSQQQIARYESGDRDPKASLLAAFSSSLGVTVSYLLGFSEISEPISDNDDYVEVPLYGSIAAGEPIEMISCHDTHPVPSAVRAKYPDGFLLKVDGESMNRVLPNGCYAYIDPSKTVDRPMKPYAVCVNGYDATIKRVRSLNNGFELVPDSSDPTYKPTVYDYGIDDTPEITVIGRVVWYCVPFDWEF